MQQLEASIIAWFVARFGDSNAELRQQLAHATVSAREFTSGAGVFLSLGNAANAQVQGGKPSCVDGPEIRSPEMSAGALATLHLANGLPGSIEIWSYAGDYPTNRHPVEFTLVEPPFNSVHLSGEP
jgi:hypothetical protein